MKSELGTIVVGNHSLSLSDLAAEISGAKQNDEFDHLVKSLENKKTSLRFSTVVGEYATRDMPIANFLSTTFGSREIVAPGAEHNALWPITERGGLADWLDINFFHGATRATLKQSYPRSSFMIT